MTKLFISHATEDKDALVRELAVTLRSNGHEVWYDEFVLKAGDSLRKEIDRGLRQADYGVVVLSKAFFEKHWTQVELDGLYSLEDENRKLILPVWHRVTREDVVGFSPTLASRLGINSSKGALYVVEQLEWAISTSNRTQELNVPKTGVARLLALSQQFSDDEAEQARLFSIAGVREIKDSAEQISASILTQGTALAKGDPTRFAVKNGYANSILVDGPFRLFFQAKLDGMRDNSAKDAKFCVTIGVRPAEYTQESATVREEINFKPRMRGTALASWDEAKGRAQRLTPIQVAEWAFVKFAEHVEKASPRK